MTHTRNQRFLQRRYRCEWCDAPIAPDEVLCEDCARAQLDREMEEEQ